MKKRLLSIIFSICFMIGCVTASSLIPPGTTFSSSGAQKWSFAGVWNTTYGQVSFQQTGNTVVGSGSYNFQGTVTGNRLQASYQGNTENGTVVFHISDDGRYLRGNWTSNLGAGKWYAARIGNSVAVGAEPEGDYMLPPPPPPPVFSNTNQQTWSFTGLWNSTYGSISFQQTGNSVYGTGKYTFSGTIYGNKLQASYHGRGENGTVVFHISDDGKHLQGHWTSNYGSGNWNATLQGNPISMRPAAPRISKFSPQAQTIIVKSPAVGTNTRQTDKPDQDITENISDGSDINFGRYFALVIGNNNYQHLPVLQTAQNDAAILGRILKDNYGFNVTIINDATRSDILGMLEKFRKTLTSKDNLLIYYAGHGWLDEDGDEGYWLPVDATSDSMVDWVSNSSITTTLKAIQAKHVLIISDSCYSGKLARGVHIKPRTSDYLSRMASKRARSVLSSGGLEPVADSGGAGNHSVFASSLISTLKENRQILDGTSLFSKIRRPVMLNSDQTPEYADIRKAGHGGGEFLFIRVK